MATISASATIGSKLSHGAQQFVPNGSTADVTLSFDDTKIVTKGQLLDACKTLIEHMSSGKLK
jgi:hypothetical protein